MVDLQIVGGGPAGLCAALYAARAGLSVRVFDRTGGGGQLWEAAEIENYPGVGRIRGAALAKEFLRAAEAAGAEIVPAEVTRAEKRSGEFYLTVGGEEFLSRTLILANGAAPRRLAVPGEREFAGKGVSYCAVCDGRFYGGKTVVVVGGGDSALSEALYLAGVAARVHLVHRRKEFRGSPALLARLREMPQVIFHSERTVTEIRGDRTVDTVALCTPQGVSAETLTAEGVFIAIGRVPENGRFANLAEPDLSGYFAAGENCRMPLEGLFAAGDTRTKSLRQLTGAVADGAFAAEGARAYLLERTNGRCLTPATVCGAEERNVRCHLT